MTEKGEFAGARMTILKMGRGLERDGKGGKREIVKEEM